jgi:hypothetical protein
MQVISTLAQVWVSHDEYYVIGVHRTAAQPMQYYCDINAGKETRPP